MLLILVVHQKLYKMIELMMAMAAMMPVEKIVEEIKDHATNYTLTGDEKELQHLEAMCMMLLSKKQTGDSLEKAMEASENFEKMKREREIFFPEKS